MNDYLDQVEAQLTELTEHGAHRRLGARRPGYGGAGGGGRRPRPSRRRSEALALLSAFAVAAAVVAIVVLNVGSGKPRRTSATAASSAQHAARPSTTASQPTPTVTSTTSTTPSSSTPLPSTFSPQSFTAISELTWWLLGSAPCPAGASAPCAAILQTTDGGPSFTAIPAPAAPLSTSGARTTGYSQLRFADAENGFAYGPDLYATHDDGGSWKQVDLGGTVTDLAISAGEAYAVVASGDTSHLMRSPVGQDQWTTVAAAGDVSGGLWVQGSNLIVQSGAGTGYGTNVLVSHDGGAGFASYPAPSPGLPCQFEGQATPFLWAHCATGMESGVWRSTDGGASFSPAISPGRDLGLPNSAAFGAASGTTAVVGYQQLYRTADAGATWTPVGPSGIAQWTYIGFSDTTHGVALGYVGQIAAGNERLYYTTDAGQTYHLVSLP
jgi:hypothetical protein